jgi:hypothetical protein
VVASPNASMSTRIGIIFRELIGVLRRMAAPLHVLAVGVAFVLCPALAAAQGSDTVYDEAGALSVSEEQRVQQAFDSATALRLPGVGQGCGRLGGAPGTTDQGGHRGASS